MFHVSCFMKEIVPAIIAKDLGELKEKIKLVEPYVNSVQIDIMDGIFVSNKTWNNPEELKNIKTELSIEAHLMVEDAVAEAEKWLDSGVRRILIHYEAIFRNQELGVRKWEIIFKKCAEKKIELGIALNLETAVDVLEEICHCESADRQTKQSRGITARLLRYFTPRNDVCIINAVQLMSIAKIGHHGEPFDARVIPKIKALRQKFPGVKIEVDGGINLQNARLIAEAGADVLVIGSAIFKSENTRESLEDFKGIV